MVKPGYKQTELGELPEDWNVSSFGELIQSTQLGGNYPNSEAETPYPLMKMGNMDRGAFNTRKVEFVTRGQTPVERDRLKSGDVLFNTRNTLDLVGKVAIWNDELPHSYFNSNIMRLKFRQDAVSSNAYMNFALNSHRSVQTLRELATGTTSVAAIYTRDLHQLPLTVPTKEEQVAIAAALSDADGLIAGLEALIAKKRDLKTATMQQLLTGKTRLPGFGDEWAVRRVDEFTTMRSGTGFPVNLQGDLSSETPFFKVSDFNHPENATQMSVSNNYLSDEVISKHGYKPIPKNSIVIAKIGAAVFLERKRILDRRSLIDNNMMALVFDPSTANFRFLHQLLLTIKLSDLVSATALPSLSATDVGALKVQLPTLDEQAAIADVLVTMDDEVELLVQQLFKAKDLKQGMMQELLTGRTRLI